MEIKNTDKEFAIFPGIAPGSEGVDITYRSYEELTGDGFPKYLVDGVSNPVLVPYIAKEPNGKAVVVVPGGAFKRLVMNVEGEEVAEFFNSIGVSAFVLKTRLPYDGHKNAEDVILVDVQRAIRYVKYHASEYGINPEQVGVAGFSAGATGTIKLSMMWDKKVYEPIDDIDLVNAKPAFCLCGYPVVSAEVEREVFKIKYKKDMPEHWVKALSDLDVVSRMPNDAPPMFIFDTDTDTTTPAENSVLLFQACRKAGVPVELHILAEGGHGFGVGTHDKVAAAWTGLFKIWLERRFLSQSEKTPSS